MHNLFISRYLAFRRVNKDGITYYQFYSSEDTVRFDNNGKLEYLGNTHTLIVKKEGFLGNYYSHLIDTIYIAENFSDKQLPKDIIHYFHLVKQKL